MTVPNHYDGWRVVIGSNTFGQVDLIKAPSSFRELQVTNPALPLLSGRFTETTAMRLWDALFGITGPTPFYEDHSSRS